MSSKRTKVAAGMGVTLTTVAIINISGLFQKETLPSEAELKDRVTLPDGTKYIDSLGPNTHWSFDVAGHSEENVQKLYEDADRILLSEGFEKCSSLRPYAEISVGFLEKDKGTRFDLVLHKRSKNPERAVYADDCGVFPGLEAHFTAE